MIKYCYTFVVFTFFCFNAAAQHVWRDTTIKVSEADFFQTEQEKKDMAQYITELIPLLKVEERADAVYGEIIPLAQKEMDELSKEVWDTLIPAMVRETAPAFQQFYAEMYQKEFTSKEMGEILAFYKTDTGKKLLGKQEEMFFGLMSFKQSWGQGALNFLVDKGNKALEQHMLKKPEDCKFFHDGSFEMKQENGSQISWTRKDTIQTEQDSLNRRTTYIINWQNECKYTLTVKESELPALKPYIGAKMEVQLSETDVKNKTYKFRSFIPAAHYHSRGEVRKKD